ncbi:acyl carrier protein [Actinosynnema sp. NPDC053489]|uniref:acyl carrier protein n=1 Tax=Actinosynnema sp. NPDC053489 TaxID=3363916 RepID=UPI0037C4FBCA
MTARPAAGHGAVTRRTTEPAPRAHDRDRHDRRGERTRRKGHRIVKFTLDDLNRIIETHIDIDGRVTEDALDIPYAELGMDSLGLVELAERINIAHHVPVPLDIIEEMRTPRLTVDYVNEHLGGGGAEASGER